MLFSTSALLAAVSLIGQVSAHGYVPIVRINGTNVPGWDVTKDGYMNPQPLRIVRATKPDSGFISNPASGDITCSIGNSKLPPGPITATVAAGQTITVVWNTWPIGHYGPIINYMAKCGAPGCSSWKGDSGAPWFKISQETYNGEWPSDKLARGGFTSNVRIPANIEPGDYLLRHEQIALHGASQQGGAQFYPVCIQLTVVGGGSLRPSGLSFPGAYKATDPGILFNPYRGDAANRAYVVPGGPVYAGLT
ncbi:endoglucanase-4 [Coprinopsis marcescibilis]|uniref:lytic cellulose monooxygenase (C4-dehydrogenating) n=1 Tax=Coprinopsis marcescibilis TaxID=230819 RepID=A0A5C3L672_COPMA|nr:endoglucanase-4 [Coprinopsis marcescibilis]